MKNEYFCIKYFFIPFIRLFLRISRVFPGFFSFAHF
nr:MAG TPA: hypothetical protein [Caudoviricetes sp.]